MSIYLLTIISWAPLFTSFWHSYLLSNTIHSDDNSIVFCSKNHHKVLIPPNFLKTCTFFCLLIFWINFFESHFFRFQEGGFSLHNTFNDTFFNIFEKICSIIITCRRANIRMPSMVDFNIEKKNKNNGIGDERMTFINK